MKPIFDEEYDADRMKPVRSYVTLLHGQRVTVHVYEIEPLPQGAGVPAFPRGPSNEVVWEGFHCGRGVSSRY